MLSAIQDILLQLHLRECGLLWWRMLYYENFPDLYQNIPWISIFTTGFGIILVNKTNAFRLTYITGTILRSAALSSLGYTFTLRGRANGACGGTTFFLFYIHSFFPVYIFSSLSLFYLHIYYVDIAYTYYTVMNLPFATLLYGSLLS